MKTVVYITKNKVWAGELVYDWDGVNLEEIFNRIRREQKVSEARVVLGNDVSFVTSMKFTEEVLNRESVLKVAKSWMPFQIDDECFDWKEVMLVPGEKWLQLAAMERGVLESLSAAVKKSGIKIDLVTAIGVILAGKTVGREVPVVVKWTGKENLLVVAVNGLADLVAGDINEEDLMIYTKQKWGLAVNPEELMFSETNVDVPGIVYAEKIKGDDSLVLNLPILKEVVIADEKKEEEVVEEKSGTEGAPKPLGLEKISETATEEKTEKKASHLILYLVILTVVVLGCAGLLYKMGFLATIIPQTTKPVTPTMTLTPTATATPTPEVADLSKLKVQVLNGSGVTGEAAKVKAILLGMGFVNIDTGNAAATTASEIQMKSIVPISVGDQIMKSVISYNLSNVSTLTNDNKYDLIMVLGKQ
jgi:hypothetical protein